MTIEDENVLLKMSNLSLTGKSERDDWTYFSESCLVFGKVKFIQIHCILCFKVQN